MVTFTPNDKTLFEAALKEFTRRNRELVEQPDSEPSKEMATYLTTLAHLIHDSDAIQNALSTAEITVLRSGSSGSFTSALLTFLCIGIQIGGALTTPATPTTAGTAAIN